nr:hypothetical protein [Cylindrotheca closterium]ULD16253.1 hypothetical protein [Cylindrotheca closterium]
MLKFFKFMEKWEYYHGSSFWFCTISMYLCFTTLFNHLPNSYTNTYQDQVRVRRGVHQQHEAINSVDNLAKKKYFKKMLVKHFPGFDSRVSREKQEAIIYQKAVKKIKQYQRLFPLGWFSQKHESVNAYKSYKK